MTTHYYWRVCRLSNGTWRERMMHKPVPPQEVVAGIPVSVMMPHRIEDLRTGQIISDNLDLRHTAYLTLIMQDPAAFPKRTKALKSLFNLAEQAKHTGQIL